MSPGSRSSPLLPLGTALVFCLLLAFALRLYRLDLQDLWGDEAGSVAFASEPLGRMLVEIAVSDPHPPLYSLLLKAWMALTGRSEYGLRFPSLAFGVLSVAMVYALGRELVGVRLGLVAALLAASNAFQVWYAQEVRMYTMVMALSLLATLLLLRWWRRGGGGLSLAYTLTMVAALYTHYYALFVWALHLVLFLGKGWRERPWLPRGLSAIGLSFLAFLPWVVVARDTLLSYRRNALGEFDLGAALVSYWVHFTAGTTLDPELARLGALGLIPFLLLGLWSLRRWSALTVPLLYFGLPLAGALLFSLYRPIFGERYLLVNAPAYFVLLAAGLPLSFPWLPLGLLLGGALLGLNGLALAHLYGDPAYAKSDYSRLTREIAAFHRGDDAVLLNGISQWYLYDYYRQAQLPVYFVPDSVPLEPSRVESQMQEVTSRHQGVWLLMAGSGDYDPEGYVYRWLNRQAYRASCTWSVAGQGCYYHLPPGAAPQPKPLRAVFGGTIALEGYGQRAQGVESGGILALDLRWRALQPLPADYKVFLHLRDEAGHLWGQTDAAPLHGVPPTSAWQPGTTYNDRHALRVEPGTPPGAYQLVVGLYLAQGGHRLPLTEADGPLSQGELLLGTIQVLPTSQPPTVASLGLTRALGLEVAPGLRLVGYRAEGSLQPGRPTAIRVYWQATTPLPIEPSLVLELADGRGEAVDRREYPALAAYPAPQWRPGEIVAGLYPFTPNPRLPSGDLWLRLALSEAAPAASASRSGEAKRGPFLLDQVRVEGRQRRYDAPRLQYGAEQTLGDFARLLGYDLALPPGQGQLHLTLYWRALRETNVNYTVFTHLTDGSGRVMTQHDAPPAAGAAPTPSWLSGEVVADRHELPLPRGIPGAALRLVVGMYRPETGERLATPQGADAITLQTIGLGSSQ